LKTEKVPEPARPHERTPPAPQSSQPPAVELPPNLEDFLDGPEDLTLDDLATLAIREAVGSRDASLRLDPKSPGKQMPASFQKA